MRFVSFISISTMEHFTDNESFRLWPARGRSKSSSAPKRYEDQDEVCKRGTSKQATPSRLEKAHRQVASSISSTRYIMIMKMTPPRAIESQASQLVKLNSSASFAASSRKLSSCSPVKWPSSHNLVMLRASLLFIIIPVFIFHGLLSSANFETANRSKAASSYNRNSNSHNNNNNNRNRSDELEQSASSHSSAFHWQNNDDWDESIGLLLAHSSAFTSWTDLVLSKLAAELTKQVNKSRYKRQVDSDPNNDTTFPRQQSQLDVTHMRMQRPANSSSSSSPLTSKRKRNHTSRPTPADQVSPDRPPESAIPDQMDYVTSPTLPIEVADEQATNGEPTQTTVTDETTAGNTQAPDWMSHSVAGSQSTLPTIDEEIGEQLMQYLAANSSPAGKRGGRRNRGGKHRPSSSSSFSSPKPLQTLGLSHQLKELQLSNLLKMAHAPGQLPQEMSVKMHPDPQQQQSGLGLNQIEEGIFDNRPYTVNKLPPPIMVDPKMRQTPSASRGNPSAAGSDHLVTQESPFAAIHSTHSGHSSPVDSASQVIGVLRGLTGGVFPQQLMTGPQRSGLQRPPSLPIYAYRYATQPGYTLSYSPSSAYMTPPNSRILPKPSRHLAGSRNRIGRTAADMGAHYDEAAGSSPASSAAANQQQQPQTAATGIDPMWSDTQNQSEDYQQSPQTIQITAVPNGLNAGNNWAGGWNGAWNGGWNGPWNGRQVLLVNRQPTSEWRNWVLPVAAILALPLLLGALFVPVFLKSVMFLIQILQMLGLLMPPSQLAHHLSSSSPMPG